MKLLLYLRQSWQASTDDKSAIWCVLLFFFIFIDYVRVACTKNEKVFQDKMTSKYEKFSWIKIIVINYYKTYYIKEL